MKRFRISLRLMLLLVAFFAVLFSWIGARRGLQHINVRGELQGIELWREFAVSHPGIYTNERAWRSDLDRLDALIAERRDKLGDGDP